MTASVTTLKTTWTIYHTGLSCVQSSIRSVSCLGSEGGKLTSRIRINCPVVAHWPTGTEHSKNLDQPSSRHQYDSRFDELFRLQPPGQALEKQQHADFHRPDHRNISHVSSQEELGALDLPCALVKRYISPFLVGHGPVVSVDADNMGAHRHHGVEELLASTQIAECRRNHLPKPEPSDSRPFAAAARPS